MFSTLFKRNTTKKYDTISPPELQQQIKSGEKMLILDVRSADEYGRDGHIKGSRLMPLNTLAHRIKELPTDQKIVCVCRSGARSQVACETLAAEGFTNLVNMKGGMMMWRINGLPTK